MEIKLTVDWSVSLQLHNKWKMIYHLLKLLSLKKGTVVKISGKGDWKGIFFHGGKLLDKFGEIIGRKTWTSQQPKMLLKINIFKTFDSMPE